MSGQITKKIEIGMALKDLILQHILLAMIILQLFKNK